MRFARTLAVAFAFFVLPAGNVVRASAEEPFLLSRALQFAQDRSVVMGLAGHVEVIGAIERMAKSFPKVDPALWRSSRNAYALAHFLFSGGPPGIARRVIETARIPERELQLLQGALALAEGRRADAARALGSINAKTKPPSIGGHLALVQAALIPPDQPHEQLEKLALARLLMPGSVVEEAALRRSIDAASNAGLDEASLLFLGQYHRRFPGSTYAPALEPRTQAILISQLLSDRPALQELAATIVRRLGPDQGTTLLRQAAQQGLRTGAFQAALRSATTLLTVSEPGSVRSVQARLYLGAAEIVTGEIDKGVERLSRIDTKLLDEEEQRLHGAARSLARQMRVWPTAESTLTDRRPDGDPTPIDDLIARAQTMLADAGRVLKGGGPR